MNFSRIAEIERFAQALIKGAAMGLYLTPKPGLVDLADCGSHPDLSMAKMERSLHILADYLEEMIRSLADNEHFICRALIGRKAEEVMFKVLGTNSHKGYIFLSGLLINARWQAGSNDESTMEKAVVAAAAQYFAVQGEADTTNGRSARLRYGTGGIVREAQIGLPSLFNCGVPAYLDAIGRTGSFSIACFHTLSRLMQTVEDTTTLHRGGAMGLARIRRDGLRLEQVIAESGDHISFLEDLNCKYSRLNLTMGGVADMLSLTLGYLTACGLLTGERDRSRHHGLRSIRRCAAGL